MMCPNKIENQNKEGKSREREMERREKRTMELCTRQCWQASLVVQFIIPELQLSKLSWREVIYLYSNQRSWMEGMSLEYNLEFKNSYFRYLRRHWELLLQLCKLESLLSNLHLHCKLLKNGRGQGRQCYNSRLSHCLQFWHLKWECYFMSKLL